MEYTQGEEMTTGELNSSSSNCNLSHKRPRLAPPILTPRLITDYFKNLRSMEQGSNCNEPSLDDSAEWFEDWTRSYRGEGGEDTGEITRELTTNVAPHSGGADQGPLHMGWREESQVKSPLNMKEPIGGQAGHVAPQLEVTQGSLHRGDREGTV